MKHKLTVNDFAVGDVVDVLGYLEVITNVLPAEPRWNLHTRSLEGIAGTQSWFSQDATILASPLALAKRYWGYKEA